MALKIYNTLTREKEEFQPIKDKEVRFYTCGPTVYNFAHIGNLRSYLAADFLRRTLEYFGYKVIQVKNITDVGHLTQDDIDEGKDKIEQAAKENKKTPEEIARFFENAFKEDEKKLNIKSAQFYPRATENIPEMIEAVKKLIQKGYAYEKEGAVFFNIEKFKDYGKLSGNTLKKLEAGSRIKPDKRKKNPFDFYLWRPAEKDHLMHWPSPWSEGYPGWHIECSVMSQKYLKTKTLDFHSGGEDNIFPHHENEIAQSEALNDQKFVNYWFHSGYLLVEGEKMAKSKGNFYTLSDLEKKGYDPISFRLLVFGTHYRSPLDFSFSSLNAASKNVEAIKETKRRLQKIQSKDQGEPIKNTLDQTEEEFTQAIEDDLDTPRALAIVLSFISRINSLIDKEKLGQDQAKDALSLLRKINKVLGINFNEDIPEEVILLAKKRIKLRKEKKFKEADLLRQKADKLGYEISDTKDSYIIRKIN